MSKLENGKKLKVCPICKTEYEGAPALSRKDNKTEICSACGMREAMDAYLQANNIDKGEL